MSTQLPTEGDPDQGVQQAAGGFCHTDCMVMENAFQSPLPVFASHEPAGIVIGVGANVKEFKEGDRVGCINFDSCCGECPDCKARRPIYCDKPSMKGIDVNGAWSEYMIADARFTVRLPDSIKFSTAACFMCAGITIYGSIKRAKVPAGGSIAILGIGGLGHIGTQLAKVMANLLNLFNSYRWKPDVTVLATEPVEDAVRKITGVVKGSYPGVDATILATDAPPAFDFAATITQKHGTLVLFGQPEKGITMSYFNIIFCDIKLIVNCG
ncbi:hypothetical protein PWT90_01266 [Aphanocladium album]|nr:hypothetical protein PWT90_01266 [Aphanocladium album]